MIKNDQQLTITDRKLQELRARVERLRKRYTDQTEFLFYSEATRDQISLMESEIADYRMAMAGNIDGLIQLWLSRGSFHPSSKLQISLGEFIALLRIARGLTQTALAELIGLNQSNVARYEQRDYSGYSIETLDKIFSALGLRISFTTAEIRRAA